MIDFRPPFCPELGPGARENLDAARVRGLIYDPYERVYRDCTQRPVRDAKGSLLPGVEDADETGDVHA